MLSVIRRATSCSLTAAKQLAFGWVFGAHEALDQPGALFGLLFVSLVLTTTHNSYSFTLATLAIPDAIMLSLLAVAQFLYPCPQDLESETASVPTERLSRTFWAYLAAVALVAAGFADFPIIAYCFQRDATVSMMLIPIFYAVAMIVSGLGSLAFGRLFDCVGIALLIPLTLVTALYASLVFSGGFLQSLAGTCLWGLGMGVHESIIPAAVASIVAPDRRASAYGLFSGVYGMACFIGSTIIGALFNVSLTVVMVFAIIAEPAAIPL